MLTGRILWLGLPLLAACSAEGELTLHLLRADFDTPFDGVEELQLRLLGADFQERERFSAAAGDESVVLGVASSGTARLEVHGVGGGKILAGGQSRLLELESGKTLREVIPFATPGVAVALSKSHAIASTITVDGSLDEWQASPSLVLDASHRVAGAQVDARDLRAELYLAWSGGELAFGLLVEDDCPSLRVGQPAGTCGTAQTPERIFLGFDGDDDGTGYGVGDLWIEITATSLMVRRGTASQGQLAVVVAPRADLQGWRAEGTLAVSALGRSALAAGDRVGFELVLVDADPGETPPTVLRWSGGTAPADQPTPPQAMGTLGFGQL